MDQPPLETRHPNPRSRSNTAASMKSRKRPLSRASTTSVHSGLAQPLMEHQPLDQATQYQKQQWYDPNVHAQQQFGGMGNQMTPEDMVIQSASQLQNPQGYDLDPALGGGQHHGMTYPHDGQYKLGNGRQSIPAESFGASYGEGDMQMMEGRSDGQDDVDSVVGTSGPAKKPSKSSAANELEMRQLFQQNKHRTLPEIATELHGNERGPQSERQRQVFAMLWINGVCSKGKGSVPRGRVYANYVSRCTAEKITVLNPASFGKLVRVLFPGLKTRRLGVRGESKYHYVGFSLKNEQLDLMEPQATQPVQSFNDSTTFPVNLNDSMASNSQFPLDRAVFPSPDLTQIPDQRARWTEGFVKPHSLYQQPDLQRISQLESTTKMSQHIRIAHYNEPAPPPNVSLALPSIQPYLPSGTDRDSAGTLSALYQSHCTSLIEAMRWCKAKTFFHLFTSFHGTLTMPVQKLFANASISPWIQECDYVMYQQMMRIVAPVALQVAPPPVLDAIRNISERLVSHIQTAFHGHPNHVIEAKVAPATLFAGLLDRLLRANLTAHAAANMLSNQANRDSMYQEWITMVRTRKIAECVPTRGMDDVVNLLLTELRDLLSPVNVSWDVEGNTPYGEMSVRTGRKEQANMNPDAPIPVILDRWINFLESLPSKFPYATHAEIVWCVQSIGTAVMRDITMGQGKSFGAWWVTKCWVDEMISFLGELGGFMDFQILKAKRNQPASQRPIGSRTASQRGSRYSSGSDEFLQESGNLGGPVVVPGPMDGSNQTPMDGGANHDDSGIGIRTPDDDFGMAKYENKYDYERNDSAHAHLETNFGHSMSQNSGF